MAKLLKQKKMEDSAMNNRRTFIKKTISGSLAIGALGFPLDAIGASKTEKITILHTNDVHSQIEPFPSDHKTFPGQGGIAYRASIIEKIRNTEKNVLLLDAGDIFQGTPYFNLFGGEVEFKLMSKLGYDVATLGNHDFDLGIDNLVKQLPNALFSFVNCNYDFSKTALKDKILPYKIIKKGKLKIGILGVGIELNGLVPDKHFEGIVYQHPIKCVQKYADILKNDEKCHLIICLSHLGNKYDDKEKVSDEWLAQGTRNIDLIIGGHTHTFLEKPISYKNLDDKTVIVNQVGWAGVNMGRIDFSFEKKLKKNSVFGQTVIVDKKSSTNEFFL